MTFTPRDYAGQPKWIDEGYKSTGLRGPTKPLVRIPLGRGELAGPRFGQDWVGPLDTDLTRNGRVNGEPLGERIIVTGRVLDDFGRPVRNTVVEVWQANAAGRYIHKRDQHDAPIDPNFRGSGRCVTDDEGRYRFLSVKPGAYPWRNHHNAWRPNHIHFSLFGPGFASRLVTQMYFPGDPLLALDPIYNSAPPGSRELMIADFDIDTTEPEWALGYRWDIVLRGRDATPMED
ncbi:protocatechuate 3,4-dioxygenase subunit beta [Prosthecomicrobium sp. N25]|uniref:protocatechuate 3,4-dioxygenase subunit beta n=1 Tax=Prosthecomicrobium sp. N25 TaxID=3129254 RepID=UPI0030770FA8